MSKFWKRVEQFPPIACRILARHKHGPPISGKELSDRSGLSILRIEAISEQTTWKGIELLEMRSFTEACGIFFADQKKMRRIEAYISPKQRFLYLKKSPLWNDYYKKLLKKWMEHYEQSTKRF